MTDIDLVKVGIWHRILCALSAVGLFSGTWDLATRFLASDIKCTYSMAMFIFVLYGMKNVLVATSGLRPKE
jgi:hypothetical protein